MRIGILGPLEVADGERLVEVGGARLRALLTLLALEAGRVVPAERLIDDLWEANPPVGAPNALQSLVSRLRAALGNGRELIESRPAGYRLAVARSDIDAFDFETRVSRARRIGNPLSVAAELREALALWRGPALADVAGAPFAEGPIARLEGLWLAATEERIEADLALGRYTELIPELEALTATHRLREPLRGRLMRALYGAGRQADALSVYEDTKRALADTLGVDPSAELENIYLSVLRHDLALSPARPGSPPGQADPRPPLGEADPAPPGLMFDEPSTNLRAQLTSFIGRDTDLIRVGKLLGEGRLVTLTGPGGAGKTRLSMEAGQRLLDRVPDGVWLVELAPVTDPAEVPHAVLTVLGLREMVLITTPRARVAGVEVADPLDRLAAALAGKRLLLILDNCEHLIDAAARLADRLLAGCPGLRILATSREPLGITGESLWPVEPLALPHAEADAGEAMTYPAVRLLADRAVAVRPGFAVTSDNVAGVVRICRALDGMPLAIELAAARLRALSPEQIAARLDDRFRLLTAGSRTALPRHQTLRAVVEWSWDLLEDDERTLWRRLSIFAGGATVESAETVCSSDLDTLAVLVEKSLVIVTDGEGPSPGAGWPRYRMLETIRAYGLERLAEAGEEDRVRRAHAEYFLRLAETSEPRLRGREQISTLAELSAEHDNLHAALRWAIGTGDATLSMRLVSAIGWYWWLGGHRAEGNEIASEALALPGIVDDQTTAIACTLGAFTSFGGARDMEEVTGWMHRARDITQTLQDEPIHPVLRLLGPMLDLFQSGMDAEALLKLVPMFDDPDLWLRGMAHFLYGQVAINMGRVGGEDGAETHLDLALVTFRSLGDRWGRAFCLTAQAELVAWRGDHRRAVALYEESMGFLLELGTAEETPMLCIRLANSLWLLGERDRARELVATGSRIADRSGAPESLAIVNYQLGEFARREGRLEEARNHLDRALTLAADVAGPPQFRAMMASGRAYVDAAAGDIEGARLLHIEALRQALSALDAPIIAQTITGFADLAARHADFETAALLLGAGEGIRGMPDLSLSDEVRLLAECRAALGEDGFNAAADRGRGLSVDEVLTRLGVERPPLHHPLTQPM
ncbi:MAG: putative ATPase [Actinomycetia bacterium]|nr:putative ATPase [Actinomycetes bacterium]